MPELQIIIQICTIILLTLLSAVVGYTLYMLRKVNEALDTILEIVAYYKKAKEILAVVAQVRSKGLIEVIRIAKNIIEPMLTNSGKSK